MLHQGDKVYIKLKDEYYGAPTKNSILLDKMHY
jgi:hypothetical protein